MAGICFLHPVTRMPGLSHNSELSEMRAYGDDEMRHAKQICGSIASGLVLALLSSGGAHAQAKMADCFDNLQKGSSPEIVCNFPVIPSAKEREDMEKNTKGVLKDARCTVAIRIERALVTRALDEPDYVFQSPPQPVTCDVTAHIRQVSTFPISGTFAPRVVFKDGQAVEATAGMDNVTGVSRVISWPVVQYVNRSGMVREGMMKVVNAWVSHMRKTRHAAAQK